MAMDEPGEDVIEQKRKQLQKMLGADQPGGAPTEDLGLLKMPRLTTPQRASFENWRKKQQDIAEGNSSKSDSVPVGSDPVEGFPVSEADLRRAIDGLETDNEQRRSPSDGLTDAQIEEANRDFEQMIGDNDEPDGFCDGLDKLNPYDTP
jgi:hypothetical protein